MDKREAAKLDMYRSVRDVRTGASIALIATIAALDDAFDAHAGDIAIIEALDLQRDTAADGGGAAKALAREQFEFQIADVDGIVTAYAAVISDADLLNHVNKEISTFTLMSDEDLRVHGAFLSGKIAEVGLPAALLNYGLTPAKATLFNQRYTTYHTLINLPDERAQQESVFVELIDQQFAAADRRLDLIMDKLMRQFRQSNPALYLLYKEARVINDAAGGGGGGGGGGGSSSSSSTSSESSGSSGEPSSSSESSSSSA